jgi:hypothetical protein
MRSHGVKDFPMPGAGGYSAGSLGGINTKSAAFQSALAACKSQLFGQ